MAPPSPVRTQNVTHRLRRHDPERARNAGIAMPSRDAIHAGQGRIARDGNGGLRSRVCARAPGQSHSLGLVSDPIERSQPETQGA